MGNETTPAAPQAAPQVTPPLRARQIEAVRRFGRFYTRHLGALNEGLLASPYSLTEARIIYELAHHEVADATTLSEELGLDPGYLSRVVNKLEKRGLISRTPSDVDGRVKLLSLSHGGQEVFAELNRASRDEVNAILQGLSHSDGQRLVDAMATIEEVLGARPENRVPYILRPHQPGDLGWVVQRHGELYAREYGWDTSFEGLVADIVGTFVRTFDPARERCWIAEKDGENVGSVFLVKSSEDVAQLRALLVEPRARGLGIGKRLVSECTRFARHARYKSIILWTSANLHAARRLYEAEGYRLVREESHHRFGPGFVGQVWEMEL